MSFYNIKNYSYLLQQDSSIVITGDSLAYNRYDFVDKPQLNAWDCPLAMQSWSFLLRDFLVSHCRGWLPVERINIRVNQQEQLSNFSKAALIKKHDQRLPLISQMPLNTLRMKIKNSNSSIQLIDCPDNLCFITSPKAALIESDGVTIDLKGDPDLFHGSYFKWVTAKSGKLRNIKEGSLLNLAGAADVKTRVFLTGSGSKTTEWMQENSDDRIFKYKPDLCLLLIGANNRRMNDPGSFKAALNKLISSMKKKEIEIILISPPHSTTTDPLWEGDNIYKADEKVTKPIMDILTKAAFDNGIPFINLFELFSGVPNDVWRFDNTHLTKEGNLLLYKAIVENFFKE